MNCERLEEVVTELARHPGALSASTSYAEAVAHCDTCSECLQRLQEERALTRQLQELSTQMKSLKGPATLEAQLLKSYRESISSNTAIKPHEARLSLWQKAALAAAVVLIVAVVGLRWYAIRQVPGERGAAVARPTPREPQVIAGLQGQGDRTSPAIKRVKVLKKARPVNHVAEPAREVANTAMDNNVEHEVATYFMPIGFAGPINPQDGGELVRVELSRSAMLSLGLPVNMDRFGQSVKADVLLGSDGLARAIRFVQ